ncbi:hypothetical protein GLYMA_18G135051v4 [Glycine max]|nr:hypothetical protein GLYMA_18G135051v4 [Glycine max]KAH1154387.1 hypothetical protein GYH30_049890 [Glycine max]
MPSLLCSSSLLFGLRLRRFGFVTLLRLGVISCRVERSLHCHSLLVGAQIESCSGQPYGEVSRSFVVRWKDELEPTWHLLHSSGNMHFVTYNQDLISLALLAGWTELREFYGLIGNHQVTLTHYGQSVFLLTIFKSTSEQKVYPK